jgi:hypothetical protein
MIQTAYPTGTVLPQAAVEVPAPSIADEVYAATIEFQVDVDLDQYWSVLVVRQETRLLLAYGVSYDRDADVIGMLTDIVGSTLPRWDLGGLVQTMGDGVRYGGIWNMMPTQAEVPSGFRLNKGLEQGPGPDVATSPFSTFDTSLRVVLVDPAYRALDDGTCEGAGEFSVFRTDGELAIMAPDGSRLVATASPEAPGQLIDDEYYGAPVCVFYVSFENLPVFTEYGFGPPGEAPWSLSYEMLSQVAVVEVVLGVTPEQ